MDQRRTALKALLIGVTVAMLSTGCSNSLAGGNEYGPHAGSIQRNDIKSVHDGFFYQEWDNDKGTPTLNYANEEAGRYTLEWNGAASDWNFVCGKGWGSWEGANSASPATLDKVVYYSGIFKPDRNSDDSDYVNSYLDFYGWGNNYDIEYYILESHGEFSPATPDSGYTWLGEYDSQGIHYVAYHKMQVNQPSPKGKDTYNFEQVYSVRTPRLEPGPWTLSGRIVLADHINAWKAFKTADRPNLDITSTQFQVMATEGYGAVSGESDITVSHEDVDFSEIIPQLNGSKFWGGTVMRNNGDYRGTFTPSSNEFAHVTRTVGAVTKSYSICNLAASVEFSGIPLNPSGRYVTAHVKIEQSQIADVSGSDTVTTDEIIDKKYFPHPADYYAHVPPGLTREQAIQWMLDRGEGPELSAMYVEAINYNASEHTAITFDGEATIDTETEIVTLSGARINGNDLTNFTLRFFNDDGKPVLVAYYTSQGDILNSGRMVLDLSDEGSAIALGKYFTPAGSDLRLQAESPQTVTRIVRFKNAWTDRVLTLSEAMENNDRLLKAQPYNSGWNSQQWAVEDIGDGSGAVRLRNMNDGEYLTIRSNGNNASVITQPLDTSWGSQRWNLSSAGAGQIRLTTQWAPDKALNVSAQSDYSSVVSYNINSSWNSQKWLILED